VAIDMRNLQHIAESFTKIFKTDSPFAVSHWNTFTNFYANYCIRLWTLEITVHCVHYFSGQPVHESTNMVMVSLV